VSLEGCGYYSQISFQENSTTDLQPVMRLVLLVFVASALESGSLLPSVHSQVLIAKPSVNHSGAAVPTRARL
jgi:hypothetical protein